MRTVEQNSQLYTSSNANLFGYSRMHMNMNFYVGISFFAIVVLIDFILDRNQIYDKNISSDMVIQIL